MNGAKFPKVLFFIAGPVANDEEREAALQLGQVAMRNASLISETDNPEKCDAVAGNHIPKQYRDKPVVKSLAGAVDLMRKAIKEEAKAEAADADTAATPKDVGKEGAAGKEKKGTSNPTGAGGSWAPNA